MKETDKKQQLPRSLTLGDEMLEVLRPTEWGDVSPDISNLTAEPSAETESLDTATGITVTQHVSRTGVTFGFIETIPDTDAPIELPIDSGNRNYSAESIQDTARFLLDNQ